MKNLISEFRFTPAVLVLIGMNFIPLIGVFWFGWDAGTIVFLYWVENVVIGILNIPKILSSQDSLIRQGKKASSRPAIFLCGFLLFITGCFVSGIISSCRQLIKTLPGFGDIFTALLSPVLFWSILGLTLSHIISMVLNFWGQKEYVNQSSRQQMFAPYPRIILLHIVIILSGLIAVAMGEGLAMLVTLVVLKVLFDLGAHTAEHAKLRRLAASTV